MQNLKICLSEHLFTPSEQAEIL